MPIASTISPKVWKFVETNEVVYKTNLSPEFYENPFVRIDTDGTITVKGNNPLHNGYAWDGCSPKFNFLDITWGTPDGRLNRNTLKPITYYSSLIHDVLYQWKEEVPISRKDTDQMFWVLNVLAEFKLTSVYDLAVKIVGPFLGEWKTKGKTKDLLIQIVKY